ncbi:phosphatidylinositol-4-phosphate 5-kinase, core [Tasmannia lanceolata]|uniref:phosphatidylinositol-4-phosphate 5-kinase, core n=1 Tax=Tasmannia lanceolata TaxID=3420 RepID=UPI0040636885
MGNNVNGASTSELLVSHGKNDDEYRKPGEAICKGHESYELVNVLQHGIRYFVKNMDLPKQELSAFDFRFAGSTRIRFPTDNSRHSRNTVTDFEWKDYCPAVFRHLLKIDKIDANDYMLSICGTETLRELTSPGKSGSRLYLSHDDRFVIKTMRKSEIKVLLEMLPNYYRHVKKYGNTLLTKFYGLHAVKPAGGQKVHFVVMGNIFRSDLLIHRRFDLKGSSQGRFVSKMEVNESTTFKDLDLDFSFHLEPLIRHQLLTQIKHDCNFLEAEGIMDYSLLIGLHIQPPHMKGAVKGKNLTTMSSLPIDLLQNRKEKEPTPGDSPQPSCSRGSDQKLGVKMPARAVQSRRSENRSLSFQRRISTTDAYNVILYLGIIDILQGYNMVKRIEHVYKSIQFDPQSISAVSPKVYSTRFQDFICKVFPAKDLSDQKLGVKMPARAVQSRRSENRSLSFQRRISTTDAYNVILYLGIIDILQGYNMVKRIEHVYKSIQFDPQSISAVSPKVYSTRFQDFICKVFPAKDLQA